MSYKFKINLIHLALNYFIINLLVKGSDCLKCYHCESSNINRDLNCHVEQNEQTRSLRNCTANETTCVHVKYEGINPKTGDKFFNVIRECSISNQTDCRYKKKKNLNAFVCFCKGDGCNKNSFTNQKPISILYQFILIYTLLSFIGMRDRPTI